MSYKLFIDDERHPPNDGKEWVVVRSFFSATDTIISNGCPVHISFDYDLGLDSTQRNGELSGCDIAHWLVTQDLSNIIQIPKDFTFYTDTKG